MTTALITPDILREHFETDLEDDALQRIIDDADQAIIDRFGEHGDAGTFSIDDPLVELHPGGGRHIFPHRKVDSVEAVTEFWGGPGAETETELATDDWRLEHAGRSLLRLATGTNPRAWWGRVVLDYFPVSDAARRTRVNIDLCKLALTYGGYLKTERAGDYQAASAMTPDAYQAERERLLSELGGFVFA